MKVIHLISGGDTGGAKTHIHYLLSGICESIEATLVCFSKGEFSDEAQSLGIPTVIMDDANIFRTLKRLKIMIKDGGYDIIHSHGAKGNFIASCIRHCCGLPVITTVHSDPKLDYLGRPLAKLVYGNLNAYSMRRSDYLVGVSESMCKLLISRKFKPNRLFSIYNGVDFTVEPKNEDRFTYFREYGLDINEDSVVVGIAARLDPVKGVDTLIRGFAEALKSCPQLRLAIAGDGQEKETLKKLAADLGVEDRLCFTGWISDINSFYAALDINALTSISETFPYAVTEGARARLATVSSRVGGVPMLVEDGKTGFLFDPENYEQLGKKLALLADDERLRRKLGDAIYEKALRDFSVGATTKRQLDIYAEVLRRENIKRNNGRDGIVICGAYGMGNAGDDAVLEAIVSEMRSINQFLPITALSRNPEETKFRFGIDCVYTFNFFSFRRIMKHTKLYLSGGGSLIQNVTSRRSLWYYLYTIKTAKKLGNRVMMYGCGIGPVNGKRDIHKVREVLNDCVDIITLREQVSLKELSLFGVTKPRMLVSSDPALTLSPATDDRVDAQLEKYGISPDEKYICFSVRKWTDFEPKAPIIAAAADYASDELGLTPVFILINRKQDAVATCLVSGLMNNTAKIIDEPMETDLTIGILSRMRVMVSMRLHGLVFAASQGVPLVGISYDPKVTAFLDSVGEKLCLPYEEFSDGDLKSMINKANLDNRDDYRNRIVKKLISGEKLNCQLAAELLRS